LWENKQNNELIGKSIANSKSKAKTKQNHKENIIEPELPEDIDDD
jgi:hypothetical protein